MNISVSRHPYKYFKYELDLADREIRSLSNNCDVEAIRSGYRLCGPFMEENLSRLTYFDHFQNGGLRQRTDQSRLEETARGGSKRQATRYSVHGLHEYKGKFNPQVAKALMNIFGVGDDTRVLDPFCGSGTTLVEASHLGAKAHGMDLNPFAVFLSNAKLKALRASPSGLKKDLNKLIRRLATSPSRKAGRIQDDRRAYLEKWFDAENLAKMESVRSAIRDDIGRNSDIFLLAASDLLRDYSLQDPLDLRVRRRKSPLPEKDFIKAFLSRAEAFVSLLTETRKILRSRVGDGKAVIDDCTRKRTASESRFFDCAITSPPYAMALPYIDTQRLSIVWLGLTEPSGILPLDAALIGSREVRGGEKSALSDQLRRNASMIPKKQYTLCIELLDALSPKDGFRRRAVPFLLYRYFASMRDAFTNISSMLKSGAPFALIVGHNSTTLGGKRFDINTPDHLAGIASAVGWKVDEYVPLQTYQRYGYHMTNAISAETLLLLRNYD